MYIKRDVYFSAVDQETGEERLFSTTEIVSEETYQKEFGEKAKGAAYAGAATLGTGAAAYGTIKGSQKLAKNLQRGRVEAVRKARKEADSVINSLENDIKSIKNPNVTAKMSENLEKAKEARKNIKIADAGNLEKIARKVGNVAKRFK